MMDEQTKMASESAVLRENEEGTAGPQQPRRNLEEEFNVQRAKMKDLFLQKEEDLRHLVLEKEQLESEVLGLREELQQMQTLSENQKSEIQSLQMLVSETVEASSSESEEVRRLRARGAALEHQLAQLRQQELPLAPATFVRSLARKLGAEPDDQPPPPRKNEDNELLQSIIEPLELEIGALKNKLRENDALLQEALRAKATSANASTESDGDVKLESGAQ